MTEIRPQPDLHVDWRLAVAVALWSLTGLTALVLTCRALAGAFDASVSSVVPGLMTAIATLGSVGAWLLYQADRDRNAAQRMGPGVGLAIGLLSLAAPALIAWATTVNASPLACGIVTGMLVLGLTVIIVEEGVRITSSLAQDSEQPIAAAEMSVDHAPLRSMFAAPSEEGHEVATELVQQWTRHRESDGAERIEAVLLANFAPRERETALHLPLHPVLLASPQVECETLDDSPVTATVTAAHPYGVRIEVKRAGASEQSLTAPIGVEIFTAAPVANVA